MVAVFLWLENEGEAVPGGVQGRPYGVCSRDRHREGILRRVWRVESLDTGPLYTWALWQQREPLQVFLNYCSNKKLLQSLKKTIQYGAITAYGVEEIRVSEVPWEFPGTLYFLPILSLWHGHHCPPVKLGVSKAKRDEAGQCPWLHSQQAL